MSKKVDSQGRGDLRRGRCRFSPREDNRLETLLT